jgi:hypothetical protein
LHRHSVFGLCQYSSWIRREAAGIDKHRQIHFPATHTVGNRHEWLAALYTVAQQEGQIKNYTYSYHYHSTLNICVPPLHVNAVGSPPMAALLRATTPSLRATPPKEGNWRVREPNTQHSTLNSQHYSQDIPLEDHGHLDPCSSPLFTASRAVLFIIHCLEYNIRRQRAICFRNEKYQDAIADGNWNECWRGLSPTTFVEGGSSAAR